MPGVFFAASENLKTSSNENLSPRQRERIDGLRVTQQMEFEGIGCALRHRLLLNQSPPRKAIHCLKQRYYPMLGFGAFEEALRF